MLIIKKKRLMRVFMTLAKNLIKKKFMRKEKKINILIICFFFHKNDVKSFC